MDSVQPKRVVVIGAGITGLTTSYRLTTVAQSQGLPLEVVLVEASERLGGVIGTRYEDGFLLEDGPDCFLATKPWGMRLCEELQLNDALIGTTTQYRQSFIVRDGKLLPVPQGFYLMVPGALPAFLRTPVFSWAGKLRMACDLFLPRRTSTQDESLADFVTRRLGREALVRMAQPMIGGIYTGDPQHLSMQATMPQFVEMEQRYRSLIRATLHNRQQAGHTGPGVSGPRYGLFVSLRHGMQTLVDTLAERLPSGTVQLRTRVQVLQRQQHQRWQVTLQEQPALEADAVCLCLAAPQAGQLVHQVDATLATALQGIPYASSATVNLGFRRADVANPLHGMGFVVPAIENRRLLACSFSSVKFAGRAPQDTVLLRAFVGGALQPEQYALSDAAMATAVRQELGALLGITAEPLHLSISRHPSAMAQYHVGHRERIAGLAASTRHIPGLVLAGNAYHGVGIPDCIHSGETAARDILAYLFPDRVTVLES